VSLPSLAATSSCLVESVTLAETARFLSGGSEATRFTVLVYRVDDPVDAGITADGLVLWVNKDDLVVLVGRILVDPVRVEDTQVSATTTDTLLGGGFEGSLVLELVHTLVGRLAVSSSLWNWLFATSTTNANTVDNVALLGLVSQSAGLVRSGWAGGAVNDIQLAKLPAADTEKESQDIRLLLLLKFFDVLEGTHFELL